MLRKCCNDKKNFSENICEKQIVLDFFICGIKTIQEIKEIENDVFVGSLYFYFFLIYNFIFVREPWTQVTRHIH